MAPAHPSPRIASFGGSRVAFLGGSFDPPHLGHLAVAAAARDALALDTVLFAPVGEQPLKPRGSTASFEDRVAMTRLAIAGKPGFELSLADAPRSSPEPNYTIDTLHRLRATLAPGAALFFLMGADSFRGLHNWRRGAEIPFAASLIVASRPGQPLLSLEASLPAGLTLQPVETREKNGIEVRSFSLADAAGRQSSFYLLPGLDVEISASAIRAGQDFSARLPASVADYIRARHLYR